MRDFRIRFDGSEDTMVSLTEDATGKLLLTQKYLMNAATTNGTDKVFPERGTTLFASAIGGEIIDANAAIHVGNFAAIDTLHFCSYEEHPDVYMQEDYVDDFNLVPKAYDNLTHTLSFTAIMSYKDGVSDSSTYYIANT